MTSSLSVEVLTIEEALSASTAQALRESAYRVTLARDVAEALQVLQRQRFDVVIAEVSSEGLALASRIGADASLDAAVILVATEPSPQAFLDGIRAGAAFVIMKPFEDVFLRSRIQAAAEKQAAKKREASRREREDDDDEDEDDEPRASFGLSIRLLKFPSPGMP